MRRRGAGLLSVAASAALLFFLYRSVNLGRVADALIGADRFWVIVSVSMIVPITFLRALRFLLIAPKGSVPGIVEAIRLTLAASAINVFVPAKAGDLVKSYFVAVRGNTSPGVAVAIIVYERLSDLCGLIVWCLLGYLISRPEVPGLPGVFWLALAAMGGLCALLITSERASDVWRTAVTAILPGRILRRLPGIASGWTDLLHVIRGFRRWIIPFSLLLWLAHMVQIWLFTFALSAPVPFAACASLGALALLAGQLPLTFAGVGARDVALVVLLSAYMPPESAAAMGILMSTRNFLPPLMGMPMMTTYLSSAVGEARQWRSESTSSLS
jgi:uncharacterized membrane protein YbhN (UPF0104 family)